MAGFKGWDVVCAMPSDIACQHPPALRATPFVPKEVILFSPLPQEGGTEGMVPAAVRSQSQPANLTAPLSSPLLVLSTCPDAETAARIGHALVEERLAACVNRLPGVASTYRWQGEIVDDAEVLLLIKTTSERFEALRARLVELHPYDVPEVIALDIDDGNAPYLDWILQETAL